MTEFLLSAAAFVLGTVALGLVRVLRGPADADRLLAAQLLGTGGVAALLLLGVATSAPGVADLAVLLVLLAAFASVGFVTGAALQGYGNSPDAKRGARRPDGGERPWT